MNIQTKENHQSRIMGGGSNFLSPPDMGYTSKSVQETIRQASLEKKETKIYESKPVSMDMSCYAGSGF